MNAYVDENFRYMQRYLAAHLPQAKFRIPEGTYLAWTDLRALGLSDAELKDRISRAGLFLEYSAKLSAALPRSFGRRSKIPRRGPLTATAHPLTTLQNRPSKKGAEGFPLSSAKNKGISENVGFAAKAGLI